MPDSGQGTWRESTMSTAIRSAVGALGMPVHLCRHASSAAHASLLGTGLKARKTCTRTVLRMAFHVGRLLSHHFHSASHSAVGL